jgi:predicted transcriptional regulator
MKVLLSIKPQFADLIFAGVKKFEFRKAIFKAENIKTVVVYVTKPVALIVGEFDIDVVISGEPSQVWRDTAKYAGISREYFDDYFSGRSKGFALGVGEVRKYQHPIDPSVAFDKFTAPQSYMYLDENLGRVVDRQLELQL